MGNDNLDQIRKLLEHYNSLPRRKRKIHESGSWINKQGRLYSDKLLHEVYYDVDFGYDNSGIFTIIAKPYADEWCSIKASCKSSGEISFLRIYAICEKMFGCNEDNWRKDLSSDVTKNGEIVFRCIPS